MRNAVDTWSVWADGVLAGIGAPADAANIDTLWAWSGAESGNDRMRFNNPLNTTQPEGPGNVDANSAGVKIYPTVEQGITATVITLLNGRYGIIVSNLRNSVPRAAWGNACRQLETWGTGCTWITHNYGAAPQQAGGIDLTPEEHQWLQFLYNNLIAGSEDNPAGVSTRVHFIFNDMVQGTEDNAAGVAATVHRIEAAIKGITVTAGSGLSPAQDQMLQQISAGLARIEAALRTA
jgi:hypothetical protein